MARLSALRTPLLPRPVGGKSILLGCVAVLVGVPALAWALLGLLAWTRSLGVGRLMDSDGTGVVLFLVVLGYSPLFSWVTLLVLAPLQIRAARAGWGGWAVALGTGLLAILVVYLPVLMVGGAPQDLPRTLSTLVLPVGGLLGLAFWLGARLGGIGSSGKEVGPRAAG